MSKNKENMSILGTGWSCECGATHDVPTRRAIIEPGAIQKAGRLLRELGLTGKVLLIADETTREVAGRTVERILAKEGFATRSFIVPGAKPQADDRTAAQVSAAVEQGDAIVVSVGSGTVTDLAKGAAFSRHLPHVAVATAPSMNGYASGIVALTVAGLKTTNAVRPPLAVVADVDVLAAAPIAMIRAGLGDLLSKPVCNADWKLSSIVKGERFCRRPFELIRELEPLYMGRADRIAARDPQAIATLAEALVLSGVSMVIAGSSAPASGGEHLVSHFLDMRADREGRGHDLHGAQVGVATLSTARLYERMMAISAREIDAQAIATVWERGDRLAARVREIFGNRADAILAEFAKKRGAREACEAEARTLAGSWDAIRAELAPFLVPPARIQAALDAAGAAVHYPQLGIDAGGFREALTLALCIRSRFTILDAALAFGELEHWADASMDA